MLHLGAKLPCCEKLKPLPQQWPQPTTTPDSLVCAPSWTQVELQDDYSPANIWLQMFLKNKQELPSCRVSYHLGYACVHAKSLQSCPTLCDLTDCSPSGSSVHGILQTRILEWVARPFSRGFSQPRDQTGILYLPHLPLAPPGKPHLECRKMQRESFFQSDSKK